MITGRSDSRRIRDIISDFKLIIGCIINYCSGIIPNDL